jgi:Zn-finger nucleic acid-binding protein
MELMEGGSLREAFAKGPLAPRRAWELLWPVLDALEHAHAHGVVHRDLKPENVLLDRHGQPKLTDFGLGRASRELEGVLLSRSFLQTSDGAAAAGTLEYMAPEQRRGRDPDPRADLYSFGVVLYEALTGERPLGRFPAPSEVRPELPHVFDSIVKKALAPEPERRFASAAELRRDLFQGLAHAGVIHENASGPMPRPTLAVKSAPAAPPPTGDARTCPRCRVPLKIKLLSGIELDDCAQCHGLWFDPNELEALVQALADKRPTRETARVARQFLDQYQSQTPSPQATGVACVICGRAATTFQFVYDDREVRVDRCLQHGAWLDWESQVALRDVLSTTKGVSTFIEAVKSLFERGGR